MIETRILKEEIRSLNAKNVEIRMDENSIFILGSLPIRSLSEPITDRKTGKKFREKVEPRAFKLALLENKAKGIKTELLKNHNWQQKFNYYTLEFDEINEKELRFEFVLPKSLENLELLKDINEDCSFSFGFIAGKTREYATTEVGIDYIRVLERFEAIKEISILDMWTAPCYSKAKGFKANDYQSGEKKAQKFITKKNREALCEKHDEEIQKIKRYVEMKRKNALFGFGANIKISMN
ncbi:MAG: HK97 family phage prohead protease [Fusobacterium sp.]